MRFCGEESPTVLFQHVHTIMEIAKVSNKWRDGGSLCANIMRTKVQLKQSHLLFNRSSDSVTKEPFLASHVSGAFEGHTTEK